MKERKTFFDKNNRLNRGYTEIKNPNLSNNNLSNNGIYNKKFQHLLPPLEVISAYEDIYPGTLSKIIAMAEREQMHRHKFELAQIEANGSIITRGQKLSLLTMLIICLTIVMLTFVGSIQIAAIFGFGAFLVVGTSTIMAYRRSQNAVEAISKKGNIEKPSESSDAMSS